MAMMPVCQALARLAHLESPHVQTLAPACRTICDACEEECRKHEKMHAVCRQCADACSRLSEALAALA